MENKPIVEDHELIFKVVRNKYHNKDLHLISSLKRYLVLDLSLASIHAAISQLNNENLIQYKERIFSV